MSLAKKFAGVGGATGLSRIAGFVREALIGAVLGAGPAADAFYAAFRFPNLFRRLFAEGAFNSAFVPLFAKELEGGEPEARDFASDVLSVLLPSLIVLTVAAIALMPMITATVIAPAFADTPDKFELTVEMGRIMFPYLLFMSLIAMLSGILNAMRRYVLAALVPVVLNLVLIGALLAAIFTEVGADQAGLWLAWGVFAAGPVQLAILWASVRRAGFTLRPRAPRLTPKIRRMLVLMGPAVVTGGITQINLLVGQIIASAQDGAIALLNYADRVAQLPLGVIGVAVGVVLLPELARALQAGDAPESARLQDRSLEFALGLTLPAAVGLMVLPQPIIELLYERGAFTPALTSMTAAALAGFAAGLPAFVLIKVLTPAFYAREAMRAPMWFSLVSVIVNIAASLALFPVYGHVAIAVATSVAAWVNVVLLVGALYRSGEYQPSALTLRQIALMAFASAAMGVAVHYGWQWVAAEFSGIARLAGLVAVIALGAALYGGLAIATGALDRQMIRRLLSGSNIRRA